LIELNNRKTLGIGATLGITIQLRKNRRARDLIRNSGNSPPANFKVFYLKGLQGEPISEPANPSGTISADCEMNLK
jgi:hypothetical protein